MKKSTSQPKNRMNTANQSITQTNRVPKYSHVQSKYKQTKKVSDTNFDPTKSSGKLAILPPTCFRKVMIFCISDYQTIMNLKSLCRRFYCELSTTIGLYQYIVPHSINPSIDQIMNDLRVKHFNTKVNDYQQYYDKMECMFQYGATKLNLPDKLLEQVKLTCKVTINKRTFEPKLLFRKLNFASHIYFKIMLDGIACNMKHDTYDSISITIEITSQLLKLSRIYRKDYECQHILQKSHQQKAFNYMTDGNYLFTYFDQDKSMLYFLFETSSIELMNYFWKNIKSLKFWNYRKQIQNEFKVLQTKAKQRSNSEQKIQRIEQPAEEIDSSDDEYVTFQQQRQVRTPLLPPLPQQQVKKQTKKPTTTFLKPKKIEQQFIYTSMKEYLNDQQDFELMINVHTGIKGENLFYLVDTKALPKHDKDMLYITYQMKERINLDYKLYLDNKMGMREMVNNLYLCDITFKDLDLFRCKMKTGRVFQVITMLVIWMRSNGGR